MVTVSDLLVMVHAPDTHQKTEDKLNNFTVHVADYKRPRRVWIGHPDGNSILIQTSGKKYVYIGENMTEFELADKFPITEYYSAIGPNDIPYPVALSKTQAYFVPYPNMYVSRDKFESGVTWDDMTSQNRALDVMEKLLVNGDMKKMTTSYIDLGFDDPERYTPPFQSGSDLEKANAEKQKKCIIL